MKLYDFTLAPNPRRVRMFLAEKGIDVPMAQVNTREMEQFADWYQKIVPQGIVPALELDDGTIITESLAICRYLEAAFPDPPLMGRDATEQGVIEMWSQRIYGQLLITYGFFVRHSLPLFADVVDQVPAFAESQKAAIPGKWEWLEAEMADGRPFIAGEAFSMADIQAMTVLWIADGLDLPIPEHCASLNKWATAVRKRPSWDA